MTTVEERVPTLRTQRSSTMKCLFSKAHLMSTPALLPQNPESPWAPLPTHPLQMFATVTGQLSSSLATSACQH